MAWVKLEDTFRQNPKLRELAKELGIRRAEARGLMAGLWSWAVVNAVDGDLSDFDIDEISAAADWFGEPKKFVSGAIRVGLLDKRGATVALHGWMRRAESYKKALQKQSERARRRRQSDDMSPDMSATCRQEKRREEKRRDSGLRHVDTRVERPVALRRDPDAKPWSPSQPVETPAQFLEAVQRIDAHPSGSDEIIELLRAGPIPPSEMAYAVEATEQARPRSPVPYLIGIIKKRRESESAAGSMAVDKTALERHRKDIEESRRRILEGIEDEKRKRAAAAKKTAARKHAKSGVKGDGDLGS